MPIGSLPDGEMMFHSDGAYDRHPYRYTMLYAVELPSEGGNTLFANLCKAYDALPDRLKVKLSACTALQEYYSGTVMRGQNIGQKNGSEGVNGQQADANINAEAQHSRSMRSGPTSDFEKFQQQRDADASAMMQQQPRNF